MPRRRLICIAVVVLGCAAATTSATARGRTTAAIYRPFSPSGAILMSGPTKSGYCWTSSETTPRHDAWRCFIGNEIHDPCFSSPAVSRFVLCPTAPWRNAGIRLRLTKPLPTSFANHGAVSLDNQPWAVQLYNGRKCVFSGGASSVLNGQRLNYFCTSGGPSGLWGYPDRRTEPWTIYSAPYTAAKLTIRVTIRRAWM